MPMLPKNPTTVMLMISQNNPKVMSMQAEESTMLWMTILLTHIVMLIVSKVSTNPNKQIKAEESIMLWATLLLTNINWDMDYITLKWMTNKSKSMFLKGLVIKKI